MKFLIDAQLPRRLALAVQAQGHDAVHTLDLPDGNYTSDKQINELSLEDQRVVVTKDADFVNSFLVLKRPFKLLLVSTGNITNRELEVLFLSQLPKLVDAFKDHSYIEVNRTSFIVHS